MSTEAEDAAAAFQPYLEKYLAEVPGGSAGDEEIRKRIATPFMDVTAEDVRLDTLTEDQVNGWFGYAAWELWELIVSRSQEGESGLIPRQEYETISFVQMWAVYPEILRRITAEVGVDAIIELGRVPRREVSTKCNVTRNWAIGMIPLLGRGIAIKLGLQDAEHRREDIDILIQTARRMQYGTWGEGCGFVSGRGFASPALDADVLQPLLAEVQPLADPEVRKAFRRFNGTTELFGFLLHYDNRAGMADTGPYPLPDGSGFVLVRDHILNETEYSWVHEVGRNLPYSVTEILVFRPDGPLEVTINDISTTFTKPTDYLKHLDSVAVFARDERTTPMEGLRLLDPDEQLRIAEECSKGMLALYQSIAEKDRDQRLKDGIYVYNAEMLMPQANQLGIWDDIRDEIQGISPLAEEAWPTLAGGAAAEVLPPVFLLGEGFAPIGGGS